MEEYFVKVILGRKSQLADTYPKLLIVTPPVVREDIEYCKTKDKYLGAMQKSKKLNEIYQTIATKYSCYFIGNDYLTTGSDGVHLTKESHKKLAEMLRDKILEISF